MLAATTPVAVVGCRLLSACAMVPARTQRSRVLQRLPVTSCAARSRAVGGARGDVCHSNLQSSPADWPGGTRYRNRRCVLQHSPADWPAGGGLSSRRAEVARWSLPTTSLQPLPLATCQALAPGAVLLCLAFRTRRLGPESYIIMTFDPGPSDSNYNKQQLIPEVPAVWPHMQPDFPLKRHAGKSDVAQ